MAQEVTPRALLSQAEFAQALPIGVADIVHRQMDLVPGIQGQVRHCEVLENAYIFLVNDIPPVQQRPTGVIDITGVDTELKYLAFIGAARAGYVAGTLVAAGRIVHGKIDSKRQHHPVDEDDVPGRAAERLLGVLGGSG